MKHGFRVCSNNLAYLLHRKKNASLVVREHDRDERRVGSQSSTEFVEIELTLLIYPKPCHCIAILLELATHIARGFMFDKSRYNVFLLRTTREDTFDGPVV